VIWQLSVFSVLLMCPVSGAGAPGKRAAKLVAGVSAVQLA
jgi:hypothetical protein